MNISDTLKVLNTLLSKADKRSEEKIYKRFIQILSSLEKKNLTAQQLQKVEDKLSSLKLEAKTDNKKKYYTQKLSEFITFLKNEFSFTTEKYYTETGMIYDMIFGMSIGLSIGVVFDPALGTSIGLSMGTGIGMALGVVYGSRKDTEAKKQGKVI
jgi:F0F1-type ATP synthase assembly protein I